MATKLKPSYERMCSFQSMIGVAARGKSVSFNVLPKVRAYYLQPSKHNISVFLGDARKPKIRLLN